MEGSVNDAFECPKDGPLSYRAERSASGSPRTLDSVDTALTMELKLDPLPRPSSSSSASLRMPVLGGLTTDNA